MSRSCPPEPDSRNTGGRHRLDQGRQAPVDAVRAHPHDERATAGQALGVEDPGEPDQTRGADRRPDLDPDGQDSRISFRVEAAQSYASSGRRASGTLAAASPLAEFTASPRYTGRTPPSDVFSQSDDLGLAYWPAMRPMATTGGPAAPATSRRGRTAAPACGGRETAQRPRRVRQVTALQDDGFPPHHGAHQVCQSRAFLGGDVSNYRRRWRTSTQGESCAVTSRPARGRLPCRRRSRP